MKTIAVDLHGVVHRYSRGWQEEDHLYDPPVEGAFDALRELRHRFRVVIYTTEAGEPDGVAAVRAWFHRWDGDDLTDLEITDRKPIAVAYIDDHAIRFLDWEKTLAAVEVFVE